MSMTPLLPEIILSVIVAILFLSIFAKKTSTRNRLIYCCLIVGLTVMLSIRFFISPAATTALYSSLIYDQLANIARMLLAISFLATLVFAFISQRETDIPPETYLLLALSTLGAFITVAANEFITLYVGMELLTIPTYILIALNREKAFGIKSAMKYVFTGIIASAFLLVAIAFIMGICGSTLIDTSCLFSSGAQLHTITFVISILLLIIGIGFKAGLVPTQGWMPDAYAGSLLWVTHFLATLPKIVGIAVLFRLIVSSEIFHIQEIQYLIFIFAAGSVIFGTSIALLQKNFRKLIAYAGIAHMGFIFFATIVSSKQLEIFYWYFISYIVATIGIFAYLLSVSTRFKQDEIADHKGMLLGQPLHSVAAIIMLLSFAGLPPTLGFWAKFYLVLELLRTQNVLLISAAAILLIFTVIGFYFYLMVIKTIATPDTKKSFPLKVTLTKKQQVLQWISLACAIILITGGILPEQLLTWIGN